jgi:hypothetical protein
MEKHHDRIFENDSQDTTFENIEVTLLKPTYSMPGVHKNMLDCLQLAKAIRVSDCTVFPEREEHFTQSETNIWIPGMAQAPGMLAGSSTKPSERMCVILSPPCGLLWKSTTTTLRT